MNLQKATHVLYVAFWSLFVKSATEIKRGVTIPIGKNIDINP